MLNYTLVCLFGLNFLLSKVLINVTGADWRLQRDLFEKVKAACEDQDFIDPNHSLRLETLEENSDSIISRYPAPKTYAGWEPPRPPLPDASSSDQLPHESDPTPAGFDEILERLSDSRVSPVERIADYRKIEALWGQIPRAYRIDDPRWRSFALFKQLSAVSRGMREVSSDFRRVLLNYLSRDRSKPLISGSISGLTDALSSSNSFEQQLAKQLQTHILMEDLEAVDHARPNPAYDETYRVIRKIHKYWTPVHDPRGEMDAYIQEILDHLRDYSTPLWDRINAYFDLAMRTENAFTGWTPLIPHEFDRAIHYLRLQDEEKKAVIHTGIALRISKFDWSNLSVRKLVVQLHTLDRSHDDEIIKLRRAIEKVSKDTSLDYNQLSNLHSIQRVFFNEHFPDEERTVREGMSTQLKDPKWYNGEDEYSKIVKEFLERNNYDMDRYVEFLKTNVVSSRVSFTLWRTFSGNVRHTPHNSMSMNRGSLETREVSSTRSRNILNIIRHISKYNLKERAAIRFNLATADIVS